MPGYIACKGRLNRGNKIMQLALDPKAKQTISLYAIARYLCSRAHKAFAAARPSARATIGYLVYNNICDLIARDTLPKTAE